MKLIKPSFEILEQQSGLDGIFKQIEIAGRTCYKSEDKITEDSAKEFVDRIINSGHGAMLEHGTVYLKVDVGKNFVTFHKKYFSNKYSVAKFVDHTNICCITTNYRTILENGWLDDLKYICEPTENHAKRLSVRFIMDRIGSQSFCRHRVFSFAQESTRYCNYYKDKFNGELTFIQPCWITDEDLRLSLCRGNSSQTMEMPVSDFYIQSLQHSEMTYMGLLDYYKWSPQQARSVLPNSLKTELVMTGFINDWKSFFKLRTATAAHPQARELAIPLQEWFQQNNLL